MTTIPRAALLAASLTLLAAASATAIARQPAKAAPPPAPMVGGKNLTVLPPTIPRRTLINTMQGYAAALGVKCTHCHVGTGRDDMDFASDAKREKLVARSMMVMVAHLNSAEFGVKPGEPGKVTCYTCHRGAIKPLTAAPPPPAPPSAATGEPERRAA